MTWFAFQGKNNGKAIDLAGAQEKIAVSFGFHGYNTEKQAEANPNSTNAITGIEADALIKDYNAALSTKSAPGQKNASNPVAQVGQAAENAVGFTDVATALSAFYAKLTDGKMWRSLGWLLLGVALMIVGLFMWLGSEGIAATPYGRAFGAIRSARA